MPHSINRDYLRLEHRQLPDWMYHYIDTGVLFAEKVHELEPNERITLIYILPVRHFASLFMSLGIIGVILARKQAGGMLYSELKEAWDTGKTIQYLDNKCWRDINILELGENRIAYQITTKTKGNPTYTIDNIQKKCDKFRLKHSTKATNRTQIPKVLKKPFIDNFWRIDGTNSVDIQNLNACTLIGNKKRFELEQKLEFTADNKEASRFTLGELILCEKTSCSLCHYSTVEKAQPQETTLYDGSKFYYNQASSVFCRQNKIVVLSRQDSYFDDAIHKIRQDDLYKNGLYTDKGFPVLPGSEVISWKRKVFV